MKSGRGLFFSFLLVSLIMAGALIPSTSARADFGVNWSVTFFTTPNLTGSSTTTSAPNGIYFDWGTGAPTINGASVAISNCTSTNAPPVTSADCSDYFSARFNSSQNFATAGNYDFIITSDDGIRVIIDGATIYDQFVPRVLTTTVVTRNMTAGPHTFSVEYFEQIDKAVVQFQWVPSSNQVGGATFTPVFTAVPTATPIPLTVSVKGQSVKGLALRTGPYLGASLVSVMRPGDVYTPLAVNHDEGTYYWYLVTVNGKTGWASGRYLATGGDLTGLPTRSTIFEQIDNAADTGVTAIPRSVMNMRRRPSERTELLAQIPWGAELPLLGRTIQAGDNFWYQVRYDGKVGWIYAPFVAVYGDINKVPIY